MLSSRRSIVPLRPIPDPPCDQKNALGHLLNTVGTLDLCGKSASPLVLVLVHEEFESSY